MADDRGRVLSAISVHSYSQLWMSPYGYTNNLPSDYPEMVLFLKNILRNYSYLRNSIRLRKFGHHNLYKLRHIKTLWIYWKYDII